MGFVPTNRHGMNITAEDKRMNHLLRSTELWKQLVELGVTEDSELDFDFQFIAKDKKSVDALKTELSSYPLTTCSEGMFKKTYIVSGKSGPITWSEKQLLKWVDYLIQIGVDCGCEFDGCGASIPES